MSRLYVELTPLPTRRTLMLVGSIAFGAVLLSGDAGDGTSQLEGTAPFLWEPTPDWASSEAPLQAPARWRAVHRDSVRLNHGLASFRSFPNCDGVARIAVKTNAGSIKRTEDNMPRNNPPGTFEYSTGHWATFGLQLPHARFTSHSTIEVRLDMPDADKEAADMRSVSLLLLQRKF